MAVIRLSDIFGQDQAVDAIRRSFASDRLPHGLIFAGPNGVGKGTTAQAVAAWFLCENPGKTDACGKCHSCVAIAAGAHPDFHIITREMARLHDRSGTSKATQISIEVIRRELAEPANRKTVLGRGKVFIVDQAERMTAQAQNGLLKTLEEPPGRALIILLTTHANELLATVRSRCQLIRFLPLDRILVENELRKAGIDAAQARSAAELTNGSLGLALQWIQDGLLDPAREVAASIDNAISGKNPGDFAGLLRKSADAQAAKAIERDELTSKDWAVRNGLEMFLSVAANRARVRMSEAPAEGTLTRACDAVDAIARAEKYLDANVNVALVLEQLGLTLSDLR
jgi:DNA polymerase III subunit delta'